MTIGGEMELELDRWIDPAAGRAALHEWRACLPGATLASTGRSALALILDAIQSQDEKLRTVLLPSYICASALAPFASAGLELRFLPIGADLGLPVESLEAELKRHGAGALLFVNYFGLPVAPQARAALADLGRRYWVIEDCVPGGLVENRGREIGSTGHYAFTSFRKSTPLPDGALVWSATNLRVAEPPAAATPAWVQLRAAGKLLRAELLRRGTDTDLEAACLETLRLSEAGLDAEPPARGPSMLSLRVGGFDLDAAAAARRRNYARLLKAFQERARGIQALLPDLPEASTPNLFPLRCESRAQRDALRSHLARARIFCPVHWPVPEAVTGDARASALQIADTMLGLPIDSRYGPEQMDAVRDAILGFAETA